MPVAIATISGCALSLAAERLLDQRNRRRLLEELTDVAEPRAKALREQILKSMEVLHSIASFHATRADQRPGGHSAEVPAWSSQLNVADRSWILEIKASVEFCRSRAHARPWWAAAAGLTLTALAVAYLRREGRRKAEIADKVKETTSPFQRAALATISSSCDHLLHLINNILDLFKIDAGRMELVDFGF